MLIYGTYLVKSYSSFLGCCLSVLSQAILEYYLKESFKKLNQCRKGWQSHLSGTLWRVACVWSGVTNYVAALACTPGTLYSSLVSTLKLWNAPTRHLLPLLSQCFQGVIWKECFPWWYSHFILTTVKNRCVLYFLSKLLSTKKCRRFSVTDS